MKVPTPAAWALALLLLAPVSAGAQDAGSDADETTQASGLQPDREGWYGQGGYSLGLDNSSLMERAEQYMAPSLTPGSSLDVENSHGFHAAVGYRAHPRVALQARFEYLPSSEVRGTLAGSDVSLIQMTNFNITADVKAFLLTGRFQPYGLIGIGVAHTTLEDDTGAWIGGGTHGDAAIAGRFGGGIDVYVTRNIAVYGEGSYLLSDTLDFDIAGYPVTQSTEYGSVGGGLMFRF